MWGKLTRREFLDLCSTTSQFHPKVYSIVLYNNLLVVVVIVCSTAYYLSNTIFTECLGRIIERRQPVHVKFVLLAFLIQLFTDQGYKFFDSIGWFHISGDIFIPGYMNIDLHFQDEVSVQDGGDGYNYVYRRVKRGVPKKENRKLLRKEDVGQQETRAHKDVSM